jgi:hypothetical protein
MVIGMRTERVRSNSGHFMDLLRGTGIIENKVTDYLRDYVQGMRVTRNPTVAKISERLALYPASLILPFTTAATVGSAMDGYIAPTVLFASMTVTVMGIAGFAVYDAIRSERRARRVEQCDGSFFSVLALYRDLDRL